MLKKLFMIGLILALTLPLYGDIPITDIRFSNIATTDQLVKVLRAKFAQHNSDIANAGTNLGTGKVFYVDSAVGSDAYTGTTLATATATLDAAINLCTANRGDVIYVAQGHAESGTAANMWDADVAGISIVHLGNGSNQGTYTFADTDTTVAVGAANVTIIGGRLLAGISEVVVGLSVEATAHYLTVVGMEWPEPETTTFEFNIGAQLVSDVNDVSFIGCRASSVGATGADHWLNGGAAAVQRLTVVGNIIHGEFAIAPIFSDQADTETYIKYNEITQLTASQFGIEFSGAATGIVSDNRVNATVLFEVDPGSMAYWKNLEGDTLPEGVSLTGQLGAFTGPAAGAAQDDNVKASLDLLNTDTAILAAAASPSASHVNYLAVATGTFDTTGTWSTVASHEVATVTGMVSMVIIPEFKTAVSSASDTGTIELGDETTSTSIIAASTLGSGVAAQGELWTDATLTRTILTAVQVDATSIVVADGKDIGYEVKTNALTGGSMVFHIYWTALDATGAVAAGAGGTL